MQTFVPWMLWVVCLATRPCQDAGPAKPGGLDQRIAQAMQSNPEVMMAEAKMREAEAAYREVRLRVTQEVMQTHNEIGMQHSLLKQAMKELDEAQRLQEAGLMSDTELFRSESAIIQRKNELSQLEARLSYLLGADAGAPITPTRLGARDAAARPVRVPRPAPSQDAEALLGRAVPADFQETPLREVFERLNQVMGAGTPAGSLAINGYELDRWGVELDEITVTWQSAEPTSLRHLLSALADVHDLCFVIRDYGILVTTEDQARGLYAPVIPAEVEMDESAAPANRR